MNRIGKTALVIALLLASCLLLRFSGGMYPANMMGDVMMDGGWWEIRWFLLLGMLIVVIGAVPASLANAEK